MISKRPLAKNTKAHYKNCLFNHLVPFFGTYPLEEIDADLNLRFKAKLLATSAKQQAALEAGADLRDRHGRRLRPLGMAQMAKILAVHQAILDEAIEDFLIEHNTARGSRMKVDVPKAKVTFLEMDELAYLVDAAADQDEPMLGMDVPEDTGPTLLAAFDLASKGLGPKRIADELGMSKSTITYHLRRVGVDIGRGYVGRRVLCELLGRAGPRVEEVTAMKIGHVRVHDPEGARFRIPDSKSEAGVRVVEMSPVLAEVVLKHIDRLRRLGLPTGPDDYLIPNLNGGRMSRKRAAQIVREAAELASQRLAMAGLPPLPHTTPHTLRRTYISIALLANDWDVKFVMDQVGHADSKMTMDVYAQMEKRVKRSHGRNFDRLVREAREQVKALPGVLLEKSRPNGLQKKEVMLGSRATS